MEDIILDIWCEHVNGTVTEMEDGIVFLDAPDDTYVYDSKAEAVDDCLYTIRQWLKEA